LAEDGNIRAKFVRHILNNVNAYLSASQLGITLASLAIGWLGEPAVAALLRPLLADIVPEFVLHSLAFIIAYTLITIFHIIVGEQFPKMYAIRKAEAVTLWLAAPMIVFYKIMRPFIWFLNGTSNWLLRRSGIEPEEDHESAHTEEEIRLLMQKSHKSGMIDNTEFTLVDNIFEFAETNAREIMIPRTEMICLYAHLSYEENVEIAVSEMKTRYPVCDQDKDNIIGFIHIKDLMQNERRRSDLRSLIRPVLSVPESMPISALLKQMQKRKTKLALLIDEYGGTSGLVTDEDILEEIVGEIHDEFDVERPNIELIGEDTYSVNGLVLIGEVNQFFDADIDNADYDTIGGWMYSQVEMPPRVGQRLWFGGYEFVIDEVDHMRVSRIVIRKKKTGENVLGEQVS
jgi:CBS domain containing-hemolysin-like protein